MSQRNVTVAAGVSGSGKSLFGRRLLLNDKSLTMRFMFDSEFSDRDRTKTEFCDWLGLPPARSAVDFAVGMTSGWLPFDPHYQFAGKLEEACEEFCKFAYEYSFTIPGEKIIIIPEAWRYCSPSWMPPHLANIAQSGRRCGLRMLIDTQNPNKLNQSIQNGMSELVVFKLQGDRALAMVEQYDFDREEVKALQKFEFIARNLDSGGELRGKIKV